MAGRATVDVVVDIICPWCYIGKRKLDRAIAQMKKRVPDFEIEVRFQPFFLDKSLPKEGVPTLKRLGDKFGPSQVPHMVARVQNVAKQVGIDMKFNGRTANTMNAHRLLYLAQQQGKQERVAELLFKSYFEENGNLGDNQTLSAVAEQAGVELPSEFLEGGELSKEVSDSAHRWTTERFVSGVPYYLINNVIDISGAQDVDVFVRIFSKLAKEIRVTLDA